MADPLRVRRRARSDAPRWAGPLAAAAALLLLASTPGALANPDQQRNEQRDGQSRNEQARLSRIPLSTVTGEAYLDRVVVIQARIIVVAEASFGVDFENLDRVDVSDVPLFGSLFDRPLQAGDLTDANRVGAVYDAGDGTLVAVMDDEIDLSDITVSVVNGKGRFDFVMRPRIVEIVPSALGEFGTLRSVQTTMAGAAPRDTTFVLGGLTDRKVPAGEHKVPLLGDIPVLQSLFRGTVHKRDERELLILVKPSIIVQEEEE